MLILTGFMATGKTTVGKGLAEQLGYAFVDTDELIAERSGQTVAEIFRRQNPGRGHPEPGRYRSSQSGFAPVDYFTRCPL